MFFRIIILSLIISKISGGSWENIIRQDIKKMGLVYFMLVGQLLILTIHSRLDLPVLYFSYLNLAFYLLYIVLLVYNIDLGGARWILTGLGLNFLAMALNKGKMPVSMEALDYLGQYEKIDLLLQDKLMTHGLIGPATRGKILGDIIPLGGRLLGPRVISLGDIFLGLGIFIFIYRSSRRQQIN